MKIIECPYIALPDTFEGYLTECQSYSSRATTRRKIRTLTKAMPWEFEVISGAAAVASLDRFAALNQARLEDRGLPSGFRSEAFYAYHREVIKGLAALDMVEFHFVKSGAQDIIGLYFLVDQNRNRLFFYQHGWTTEFQKFSPGIVGVASSIEYAIKQGTKEYHFLRGEEGFKYHWASGTKQLLSIFGINRNTAKGLLAHAALKVKGFKPPLDQKAINES